MHQTWLTANLIHQLMKAIHGCMFYTQCVRMTEFSDSDSTHLHPPHAKSKENAVYIIIIAWKAHTNVYSMCYFYLHTSSIQVVSTSVSINTSLMFGCQWRLCIFLQVLASGSKWNLLGFCSTHHIEHNSKLVWLARPSHLITQGAKGRDGLAAVTISSHLHIIKLTPSVCW